MKAGEALSRCVLFSHLVLELDIHRVSWEGEMEDRCKEVKPDVAHKAGDNTETHTRGASTLASVTRVTWRSQGSWLCTWRHAPTKELGAEGMSQRQGGQSLLTPELGVGPLHPRWDAKWAVASLLPPNHVCCCLVWFWKFYYFSRFTDI